MGSFVTPCCEHCRWRQGWYPRGVAARDDGRGEEFHQRAGFQESPLDPMTMMITIADVEKALDTP